MSGIENGIFFSLLVHFAPFVVQWKEHAASLADQADYNTRFYRRLNFNLKVFILFLHQGMDGYQMDTAEFHP